MPELTKADLRHILDLVETIEAEVDALEKQEDWYVSDLHDLIASVKQLVQEKLNV